MINALKRSKTNIKAQIWCSETEQSNSLVAPVQSGRDVLLDVPHAVMGEAADQHLPPQVQDFIHHVPKPVEQIPLILLWKGGPEKEEYKNWRSTVMHLKGVIERKLTRMDEEDE